MTSSWWRKSSAAVGSSRSTTGVRWAKTLARETLALSPPESWVKRRCSRCATSASSSAEEIASPSCAKRGVLAQGALPISTISLTVKGKDTALDCINTERSRAASSGRYLEASLPASSALPAEGATSPAIRDRSVDFPAPLGPTRATTSPGKTSRVTSLMIDRPSSFRPTALRKMIASLMAMPTPRYVGAAGRADQRRRDRQRVR